MDFLDTIMALREEYRSGKFQEESVSALHRALGYTQGDDGWFKVSNDTVEQLRGRFCPSCGEYNRLYPEPCSFCMAEFELDDARRVAANQARETRCVECGVISTTQVCPSCWGK